MLCERCHKSPATVRYSEVVNGKVSARSICKGCLSELETDPAVAFEVAGAPTARRIQAEPEETEPTAPQRSCPSCGLSLRVALKTGRVGCRECYTSFTDALEPQLRTMHVGLRHRGKVPRVDDARDRVRANLQAKRAVLRTALKMENYEEAALLRDEIRALESGLSTTALDAKSNGQN